MRCSRVSRPGTREPDQSEGGLGADLLSHALKEVAGAAQTIGVAALLVSAKSEAARRFYLVCAEFIEYPAESRTIFLPIDTMVDESS